MPDLRRGWRPGSTPDRIALTTKAPYLRPAEAAEYERPPAGYQPVSTQLLCRHGSRTPAKAGVGAAVLSLWQCAEQQDALTALGRSAGPAVQQFLAECSRVREGALTGMGRLEMAGIAERLARRLPSVFRRVAAAGVHAGIDVLSASKQRTQDSAAAFVANLDAAVPGLGAREIPIRIDDGLLYFHKSDRTYQAYATEDPRLQAIRSAARDLKETRSAARELLSNNFTTAFVDGLAAGHHNRLFVDEVDAATAVFSLWQVAAGWLSGVRPDLAQLVPPAAAAWFGYLDDLDTFYTKGPGFAGDDITYAMARSLLDDVFAYFEAQLARPAFAMRLCFTHAEEILPLAALLGLPGSDRQVDEGEVFTYATNVFRGAETAPMAANIQWDLYTNGSDHLVRLLHNERQAPFAVGCAPIADGSYFYRFADVRRFYGGPPS